MQEIKAIVTEMRNTFDGLNSNLDMVQERISKLGNFSVETSKTKSQRGKIKTKKMREEQISKYSGQLQKV